VNYKDEHYRQTTNDRISLHSFSSEKVGCGTQYPWPPPGKFGREDGERNCGEQLAREAGSRE
jgi:hypothetical protein